MIALSDKLKELGFHNADNSEIWLHGNNDLELSEQKVTKDTPLQIGANNGLISVYDENGEAWLIPWQELPEGEKDKLIGEYGLNEGGYVPHSHDYRHWRKEVALVDYN